MPFACIFVPDFSVEAWLRVEPDLRSLALVVLEGKAPLQKVFAVNEHARRMGVQPGMTKVQAETCSGLVLRTRSPLQEAAVHAALLDCAQSFSPWVEDAAPNTIVLDLSGLETLFGPLPKIARALAQRASHLGLEANVAVASNPDTAILAARGFSGVTVIPEEKESEQLGRLPIEVLFAEQNHDPESAQLLETLHRWGIARLGDLAALPEIGLSERLGNKGVYLQKLARGVVSRILVPVDPPLIFEEAAELEYPLVLLEPLAFLLSRMLDQICARLQARALATQELRLELELQNHCHPERACFGRESKDLGETPHCDPPGGGIAINASRASLFQRILRLPIPLLDPKTFLKLLQLDLKAHPPGAPILKIHLAAEPASPRATQNGLFLPLSPEPEKLELTLARIAGIVGEDNVGTLELLNTHRPGAFRMQHFAIREPQTGKKRQQSLLAKAVDLVTALRIFRPALSVAVTLFEGKPARISCAQRKEFGGEVLWAAGPWRSSGDWWQQDGWARDEWDIAVQQQSHIACYRLVRDLLTARWLLEGEYD
jgi:protein ImuB